MIRRARLGFAVGAFFLALPLGAFAQIVVPPATEVPIPAKPSTDSTKAKADTIKAKADTIKAPFGRSFAPRTADIGPQYNWNREELFASGAYTVADLLERVPGATSFRSGWLASPKFVAMNGDLNRIKVFYDGIELDNLDPRTGSALDLTTVELWTLENVSIERFANDLRVHLRSWRVDKTDPYTRTDVYTGDEETNIYRGYYGKRFGSGAGLQLAGQQFSTRSARLGGGGDALSFMARVGIARKMWSVDAFAERRNASRVTQPTFGEGLSLQPFEGTHTLAYIRAGIGNPAGGPWLQAIAANMRLAESSPKESAAEAASRRILPDTADTTTKRIQYLLSAGFARGALRTSVTDRVRAFDGDVNHTPSARFELANNLGLIGLFGERSNASRRKRGDAVVRFTPLSFLALAGAMSVDIPDEQGSVQPGDSTSAISRQPPRTTSARVEAGVRLGGTWLLGGFITRDTAVLAPPMVFDTAYAYRFVGRRQGLYAGLRGRVFGDLNMDVLATRWDSAGFYQPRYQARSEVNLATRWLSRFPSGNFGLKAAVIHDYRSDVSFPTAAGVRRTNSSGIFSALLEIRILRGVASYQVHNMSGDLYQIVPDFYMPRSLGVYGIRWEFWN